jgi:tRNA pseudouridine13 synthase
MLIRYLKEHSDDYIGAIGQFPKNLAIMFIHAYQSYLFNKIISGRFKAGIPLNEPIEGDLILPVDEHGLPVHKTWILVTKSNIEKITKQCRAHKAYVSGVLFGNQTEFAQGMFGELEAKVIEEEGIVPDDFIIPELPFISSKGNRRELISPVREFKFQITPNCVKMTFGLIKGAYATSLLREYMKTKIKKY